MMEIIAYELARLALFAIFVAATVEVLKAFLYRFAGRTVEPENIQIMNFAISLFACWVFGYGIMIKMFFSGLGDKGTLAHGVDYIMTSALIFMGSDWFWQKFSASVSKAQSFRRLAKADKLIPAGSKITRKSESSESTITEERKVP